MPEMITLLTEDLGVYSTEELLQREASLMQELKLAGVGNQSRSIDEYKNLVRETLHRIQLHLYWVTTDEIPL